jgi:xylulose-5-phosphate/fructose-6-phosphate phosphoketolase
MTLLTDLDHFHLELDVLHRLLQLGIEGDALQKEMEARLIRHKQHICEYGQDMPEILNWKWR